MIGYYLYIVTKDKPGDSYRFQAPLFGKANDELNLHDEIEGELVIKDRIRILKVDRDDKEVICISLIDEIN